MSEQFLLDDVDDLIDDYLMCDEVESCGEVIQGEAEGVLTGSLCH